MWARLTGMHSTLAGSPARATQLTSHFGLRRRWAEGVRCDSDLLFAFGVSFIWLALYNLRFWTDTVHAMWHGTPGSAAFFVSLSIFVWCAQALLVLLWPSRRLMLGATSAFFIVAAASSYFSLKYGVVMNKDMLRNVFQTDLAESRSLMSAELFEHVGVLGLVPALLVWKIRLPAMRWSDRLRTHAIGVTGALAICAVAVLSCSASYAVFFREHKPIRFELSPSAPVTSAIALLIDENKGPRGPLINASGHPQRGAVSASKPLVLVMVVGETARAANFELGGYTRRTNPELAATEGLIYFPETTSCGTATAISVPCMFSHLPRAKFDVDQAPRYANLLDALAESGFDVEWRDNNAGCKGVCARVRQVSYPPTTQSRFCRESYCYDEVMIEDLAGTLAKIDRDTVIVMHQIGSHGPAYAERYPHEFARFKPACDSNRLQQCSPSEVMNAYDNTIAYTDHVVARTIAVLRDAGKAIDSMLLYASDHGESLGEQGLYLHGLPYAFAPETQKHVPMLLWLSPTYLARTGVGLSCVEARAFRDYSHDNIYHTVLGAADVRNASYDAQLDILAPCRNAPWTKDHE
jgi:lipid A ethanolaminephosphotransferase